MKDKLYLKRLDVKITDVETVKEWIVCGNDIYTHIGELYYINGFVNKAGLQYVNMHPAVSNSDFDFPIATFVDVQCDINVYVEVVEKYATHVWTYNKDEGEALTSFKKEPVVSDENSRIVYLRKATGKGTNYVWFADSLWTVLQKHPIQMFRVDLEGARFYITLDSLEGVTLLEECTPEKASYTCSRNGHKESLEKFDWLLNRIDHDEEIWLKKVNYNYEDMPINTFAWYHGETWRIMWGTRTLVKLRNLWNKNFGYQAVKPVDVEFYKEVPTGEATHTYSKEYGLTELMEVVKKDAVGELGMIKIIVDKDNYVLFPQSAVKRLDKVGAVINVDIQYHKGTIASEQFICDPDYGNIEFI